MQEPKKHNTALEIKVFYYNDLGRVVASAVLGCLFYHFTSVEGVIGTNRNEVVNGKLLHFKEYNNKASPLYNITVYVWVDLSDVNG